MPPHGYARAALFFREAATEMRVRENGAVRRDGPAPADLERIAGVFEAADQLRMEMTVEQVRELLKLLATASEQWHDPQCHPVGRYVQPMLEALLQALAQLVDDAVPEAFPTCQEWLRHRRVALWPDAGRGRAMA